MAKEWVCSVCETGGDICWTNQEIVITTLLVLCYYIHRIHLYMTVMKDKWPKSLSEVDFFPVCTSLVAWFPKFMAVSNKEHSGMSQLQRSSIYSRLTTTKWKWLKMHAHNSKLWRHVSCTILRRCGQQDQDEKPHARGEVEEVLQVLQRFSISGIASSRRFN